MMTNIATKNKKRIILFLFFFEFNTIIEYISYGGVENTMSTFGRIKNILVNTLEETKMNSEVSKQELYNYFFKKFSNTQIDSSFLINDNDYEIIQKFSHKNTHISSYLINFLTMHNTVSEVISKIDLINLQNVYQNKYNYLVMTPIIKYNHIYVPSHIVELEAELSNTVNGAKQLMLFIFGSLRQMLTIGAQVYYKQPYCSPQVTYRQLESLEKPKWTISDEHQQLINTIIQTSKDHYQQLLNLLGLVKEQVDVLILYYQQYNNTYEFNKEVTLQSPTSPYFNESIENRKAELNSLKNILNT